LGTNKIISRKKKRNNNRIQRIAREGRKREPIFIVYSIR
jgi:hypothetical protein